MAGAIKQSTYLTGLGVSKNPVYVLNRYYKKILDILGKMPEHAAYRKHTENIIKERSGIINSGQDVKSIEQKLGCGQMEEVIIQARNELVLAEALLLTRPWQDLVAPIPKNQWKWPVK